MDVAYFEKIVSYIASGAGVTLEIFAVTLVFSIPIGIVCAIGKLSRFRVIRFILGAYTWVFRGTPLLLQLFFTYYGLPILTNGLIQLQPMPAALLTFVFNYAAYFTEIFRAGIQSIGRGQYEASKALGMTHWLMMRRIVLPQAVKVILPPTGNETINLIKDTALCSVIAITEMMRIAKNVMSTNFDISALVVAACIYLLLTFIIIMLFRRLEKRFAYYSIK